MDIQLLREKIESMKFDNGEMVAVNLTQIERDIIYNLLCFLDQITESEIN